MRITLKDKPKKHKNRRIGQDRKTRQMFDYHLIENDPEAYKLLPLTYRKIKDGKYILYEPKLNEEEKEKFERLKKRIYDTVSVKMLKDKEEYYLKMIDEIYSNGWFRKRKPDNETKLRVYYHILRDIEGLGPITPLLKDPLIEDITIQHNGSEKTLVVYLAGLGYTPTNISLEEEEVRNLIFKMAEKTGRAVNLIQPILEGKLGEGIRVHAFLGGEVSERGSTFTIRKAIKRPSLKQLIQYGTLTVEAAKYLSNAVRNGYSGLIIGEVGSGKTTLLNALLKEIPENKRIITLEDTPEIYLEHPGWEPLVARPGYGAPNKDGRKPGEIKIVDLIPSVLRMRPDYCVIGEVRRKEELEPLLEVITIGGAGLTTFHAKSIDKAYQRLINMGLTKDQLTLLKIWVMVKAIEKRGRTKRRVWEIREL